MPAALSQGFDVSAQVFCLGEWSVHASAAPLRVDGVSVSEDNTPTPKAEDGVRRRLCQAKTSSPCALGSGRPLQIKFQRHDLSLIPVSGQGRSIDIGQHVQPAWRPLGSRSTH